MGEGSTVWQGSAFSVCPHSQTEIVLPHSRYSSSNGTNSSFSCNNERVTIVAQIVGVSENMYISQITLSDNARKSSLIGKTVECVHDDGIETTVVMIQELVVNDTSKWCFHNVM